MERAHDELHMIGITVATSVLGRSLADPLFEPLYAELDRRGAVLYIHPAGVAACSPLIADYGLTWPIGAPISATQLIFKGIPARYPRIKIINSHLGGALPMLIGRLDNQYRWAAPELTEPPSAQARRMWYDTVGHFHVPALHCACESFGADRLVLGTDFPYLAGEGYRRSVSYIEHAGLPAADAQGILDSNAVYFTQDFAVSSDEDQQHSAGENSKEVSINRWLPGLKESLCYSVTVLFDSVLITSAP
jgi:aminocarboxymuconate-semialdehyde decarboxylase